MEPGPDDWEGKLEFTFACTGRQNSSPVSADKIFLNGQIRPSYPYKLPGVTDGGSEARSQKRPVVREPLRRLFSREREWKSSGDLYEEDELKGTAPQRYCLWGSRRARERNGASNSQKNKKNVGVSKRWKVKGLVCNHGCKKVSDEPLE